MEIIVAHQLTDFDGLAAMVAASKLYPDAVPVFPGRLHKLVKDFMALYRDEIDIAYLNDIELEEVEKVFIVDTAKYENLGELGNKLNWHDIEVIVYDHHPHGEEDWINLDLSEDVGATTTILINKLIAEGLNINPVEATIFALGIYADTGSMTHDTTTPDDMRAAAYLLKNGANLKIVDQFLQESLTPKQRQVLDNLLDKEEVLEVEGIEISLFPLKYDTYVTGLNRVAEKIKDIYNLSSLFLLVEMDGKVEIIARSNDEAVNVGRICMSLGGGGHTGAAAAQLKDSLEKACKRLKEVLTKCVTPPHSVKSIMSTPVRTIFPETSIEEAEKFLHKHGHTGTIVCEDGEIKGVFSRRDLDKVKGHDLMHAPVKGYMSREVITVEASETIREAQELMVKYNIGRLPVIEDGKMVGIITRSDILESYYDRETPHKYQNRYGSSLVQIRTEVIDITRKLDFLPEEVLEILKLAGKTASQQDNQLYLIGGMVRDLLLEKNNYDLDLVIEGNLKEFILEFEDRIEGKVSYNEQFQTASVELDSGYNLDFATTRREYYPYPGALPEVERTNIFEDLFRRDFTVNALALGINPEKWGQLFDFFQGKKDLDRNLLRTLHRFSFLDDPTRIIRGIRLALSLDFSFEDETENLMQEALELGDFSEISLGRVYKEIKILFDSQVKLRLADIIEKLPIFRLIDPDFTYSKDYKGQLKEVDKYIDDFESGKDEQINRKLIWLSIFMRDIDPEYIERLNLTGREKRLFNISIGDYEGRLRDESDPVKIYRILNGLYPEELIILMIKSDCSVIKERIEYFIDKLLTLELNINGNDLIELGLDPGPEIKDVLNRVWQARLEGKIEDREEEEELARRIIKNNEWSEN